MKLNHLNLTVTDVGAASDFLHQYFGLQSTGGNAGMAFLTDGDGFVLSLMKAAKTAEVKYPGYFHIGFCGQRSQGQRAQSSLEGRRLRCGAS